MTSVLSSLTTSPEKILQAEQAVNAKRKALDLAKIECECAESMATISLMDTGDVKN